MIDDLTALRLQLDWGVDEALADAPIDRLRATVAMARPAPVPLPVQALEAAPSVTPMRVEGLDTLDALHAALDAFTACPLRATATHTVRPSGNPAAPIVLIAEAPGSDDDRSGHAFSGADGVLIDRVLASAGLGRDAMLLTTLVPWRPPGNRPPSEREVAACLPFLRRLLGLVRPRAVVLAGAGPVLAVTGQAGTIRQLRGKWLDLTIDDEKLNTKVLPILPLAQWLRDGTTKQQLWSDVLMLREITTST